MARPTARTGGVDDWPRPSSDSAGGHLVAVGRQQQPAQDVEQQAESAGEEQDRRTRRGTAPDRRRRLDPARRRRRRSSGRSRIGGGAESTSPRRGRPVPGCCSCCALLMPISVRGDGPFDTIRDHPGLPIQGQPLYRPDAGPCDPGRVKSRPASPTRAPVGVRRVPAGPWQAEQGSGDRATRRAMRCPATQPITGSNSRRIDRSSRPHPSPPSQPLAATRCRQPPVRRPAADRSAAASRRRRPVGSPRTAFRSSPAGRKARSSAASPAASPTI